MKIKFIIELDIDNNQYEMDSEIVDSHVVNIADLSEKIAALFTEIALEYPKAFYKNNAEPKLRLVK